VTVRSRWSEEEAARFIARYGPEWGEPLALRTYSTRLLGEDPDLVLHGGGNSSVKVTTSNLFGDEISVIYVKASGADMATVEPAELPGLDLDYLRRLRVLRELDDAEMVHQLRTHLLRADGRTPSIEALVHAFLPGVYIDHTHADAVLALTNREHGVAVAKEALGEDVIVLPYVTPGFKLALAAARALDDHPDAWGMVWAHHGIVTWGETAHESYEMMIRLVSRAEQWIEAGGTETGGQPASVRIAATVTSEVEARLESRAAQVAPMLRGLLAEQTGDCDRPYRRVVLQWRAGPETLAALAAPAAPETFVSPVLTTDHLIRTKAEPLWVDELPPGDSDAARAQLQAAVQGYCERYESYLERHGSAVPAGVQPFGPQPRVVMIQGLGVFCAGPDLRDAQIASDITEHTMEVKASIAAGGAKYQGLPEEELFRMEYRTLQHAKLGRTMEGGAGSAHAPLRGHVAVVTGAAGAIGTGITEGLLEAGGLVAATDLPGEPLDTLVREMEARFPQRIVGLPLDVTDPRSVSAAFDRLARMWGGVDLVIPNAGVAAVAPLTELTLERYRELERVNVEGTLLVLAEAARMFRRQATGGDIVLVSTKNVFSPGANFGAYSSTKAAAHQLARIASLELAADDVRVNMVAPDAVFACGACRSGLWAEVGPDRMKARGLDEVGLEAYYQDRNLLKVQVTAAHVARAVLFFATRQTPTTGATIPVDGGLPDSTPR
jgi:rhamnose utilization protein RhaD (predicted bifunctional aldolase and dehydrogenase)/NAD(P)-dependent dehydrogenase (short-subunit alcohol dehydrogenase family)